MKTIEADAQPMQGLADWLRAEVRCLDNSIGRQWPETMSHITTLNAWANEVEAERAQSLAADLLREVAAIQRYATNICVPADLFERIDALLSSNKPEASRAQSPVAEREGWIAFSDRLPAMKDNGRGATAFKRVLVTNNIHARDAFGERTNVWFGSPVEEPDTGNGPDAKQWRVYEGGQYLTHWMDPFTARAQSPVADAQPEPSVELTGAQLLEALDFIAPDRATDPDQLEGEVTIQRGSGHDGSGLYCWLSEYPEEGSTRLTGAAPVVAQAEPVRTHTTQPGESLAGIALRKCGSESHWEGILALNPSFHDWLPPDYFPVGTVLKLPPESGTSVATQAEAKVSDEQRKAAAELLWLIDGSQYGLQFGDGSIRKGRPLSRAEMTQIKEALTRLAAPSDAGDGARPTPERITDGDRYRFLRDSKNSGELIRLLYEDGEVTPDFVDRLIDEAIKGERT